MDIHLRIISVTTLLLAFSWINPAISSVTGIAVVDEFSTSTNPVYDELQTDGLIEYFIPLNSADSGIYGVVDPDTPGKCTNGAGTCIDSGTGFGYASADALKMNLYFNLSSLANKDNAVLDIYFEDLDLDPINDPNWFYESVSVSYKNGNGGILTTLVGPSIDDTDIPEATQDPFTWNLDLASIGSLDNNFWIQLGFGSESNYEASNTEEYLKATISTVPVPAAVWLFGTALIGFVSMSRRTVVT
jgi:hypothetical protein